MRAEVFVMYSRLVNLFFEVFRPLVFRLAYFFHDPYVDTTVDGAIFGQIIFGLSFVAALSTTNLGSLSSIVLGKYCLPVFILAVVYNCAIKRSSGRTGYMHSLRFKGRLVVVFQRILWLLSPFLVELPMSAFLPSTFYTNLYIRLFASLLVYAALFQVILELVPVRWRVE